MYPNHYWFCEKCNKEKEGTHGDVFYKPECCGRVMIIHSMDKERIVKRNIRILRNDRETLTKDTIARLASEVFGGSVSHYTSLSKVKLNQESDTQLKILMV